MARRLWAVAIAAALGVAALTACKVAEADSPRPRGPARLGDILIAPDSTIVRTIVPPNTTLAALLARHQIIGAESLALIARVSERFDLRRVRAGQPYRLDRFLDGRVREFEYEIDGDRRLIARRADALQPSAGDTRVDFEAEVASIPKERTLVTLEGRISRETPSLIEAVNDAANVEDDAARAGTVGDRLGLALALADIFSGEIDFNMDLQPGDMFRLVLERATRIDGLFGGFGPVLVAEIVNEGRKLRAVRFTVPDGKPGYYDEEGRSLKRFLLKSPLKFDPRITSAFSRARRHPILNYTRAHNGVDYAAPTGAPVIAVAGGAVTFAGWTSGGGRTVRVRHTSGYESEYLHLSGIARSVRVGTHVAQGETVGFVGATGLATGPHLHYGLRRNGTYVNPVREHLNMPPGDPIPVLHLAIFRNERDRLMDMMKADSKIRATNN